MTTPSPQSQADPPPPAASFLPCAGCGYNIAGLAESGSCPECAHPIAASLPASLHDLPFLRCMTCNYDLSQIRGQPACPECNTPVSKSLEWVETLREIRRLPKPPEIGWAFIIIAMMLYIGSAYVPSLWGINPLTVLGSGLVALGIFRITALPDREFPSVFTARYSVARAFALGILGCLLWRVVCQIVLESTSQRSLSVWDDLYWFASFFFITCHIIAITAAASLRSLYQRALAKSPYCPRGPSESES